MYVSAVTPIEVERGVRSEVESGVGARLGLGLGVGAGAGAESGGGAASGGGSAGVSSGLAGVPAPVGSTTSATILARTAETSSHVSPSIVRLVARAGWLLDLERADDLAPDGGHRHGEAAHTGAGGRGREAVGEGSNLVEEAGSVEARGRSGDAQVDGLRVRASARFEDDETPEHESAQAEEGGRGEGRSDDG